MDIYGNKPIPVVWFQKMGTFMGLFATLTSHKDNDKNIVNLKLGWYTCCQSLNCLVGKLG